MLRSSVKVVNPLEGLAPLWTTEDEAVVSSMKACAIVGDGKYVWTTRALGRFGRPPQEAFQTPAELWEAQAPQRAVELQRQAASVVWEEIDAWMSYDELYLEQAGGVLAYWANGCFHIDELMPFPHHYDEA